MIQELRNRTRDFLENEKVSRFLVILILLNVIVFILDTESIIHNRYSTFIYYFDVISVVIFTVEYLMRVFVLEKISYIFKPLMLIDLFSIVPFYLSFMKLNTMFLRVMRMCRLLRVFKLERYLFAFKRIHKCLARRKDELLVTLFIFISGVLFFATVMYFVEGGVNPNGFGSIPKASWWAVITCTTVGYGDVCPITALGKLICGITAVFGACLHGLLIGLFTMAFIDMFNEDVRKGKKINFYNITHGASGKGVKE